MSALLLGMAVWWWGMSYRPPRRVPYVDGHQGAGSSRWRAAGVRLPRRSIDGTAEWSRFLDDVAARVRGGSHLRRAFAEAQHDQRPRGRVVHAGADFDELATRTATDADEAVVVQALTTAAALGGATAATVQAGAALLRERAAMHDEAAAHSAQARLSARVLTLVPLLFTGWSALASTSFRHALATPAGMAAGGAGLCCNALGWWWMRRVVHGASA